jgi:hypothetical protein
MVLHEVYMTNTFLGPVPPESNPPITPQYYSPQLQIITAISPGFTTTITMANDTEYVIGQQVRLVIPPFMGARELNQQTGIVIAIPAANQVTLNINSNGITPFSPIASPVLPQIIPIGDVNTGAINAFGRSPTGTYIPGAFINISPL